MEQFTQMGGLLAGESTIDLSVGTCYAKLQNNFKNCTKVHYAIFFDVLQLF